MFGVISTPPISYSLQLQNKQVFNSREKWESTSKTSTHLIQFRICILCFFALVKRTGLRLGQFWEPAGSSAVRSRAPTCVPTQY